MNEILRGIKFEKKKHNGKIANVMSEKSVKKRNPRRNICSIATNFTLNI